MADCKGYVTVGEYDDGRPGELFIKVSKQGSTLAGIMDAFAISVSHGLQYGVPLRAFVETYTNMRFEPAGMTDDPDIRFAIVARRLHLPPPGRRVPAARGARGARHPHRRASASQPTLPGVEEAVTETTSGIDVEPRSRSKTTGDRPAAEAAAVDERRSAGARAVAVRAANADAPYCMQCGVQMQRAGSCHACPSCGTTSGCS